MKLTAPFASPNIFVRISAWLVTFLLLAVIWLFLLYQFRLGGLYRNLGNAGMSDTQSMLTILALPPLLLTFLGGIGLRLATPPSAPTQMAPAATSMAATATAAAAIPAAALRIAAWSAVTPFGNAAATIERHQAREKLFRPDGAIRNDDGHPVHAAAVDALPLQRLGFAGQTRRRAMRVSALLLSVLDELHDQQVELVRSTTAPATIHWLVPAGMALDDDTRAGFATAWTHSRWHDIGYSLHAVASETDSAYGVVDGLQRQKDQAGMLLLLAADSLLDPDELALPLALGQVYTHKSPDGFIPAEGAAGLLLLGATQLASVPVFGLSLLAPVQRAPRGKSDVESSVLTACISEAMTAARIGADGVGAVVSDTDHRSQASMEVIQAMVQTLPALDPLAQRIAPMEHGGNFGAAADLIHMALAAEMAADTQRAILTVSVAGANWTAAALVIPHQS